MDSFCNISLNCDPLSLLDDISSYVLVDRIDCEREETVWELVPNFFSCSSEFEFDCASIQEVTFVLKLVLNTLVSLETLFGLLFLSVLWRLEALSS